ncbi:MAG TPA: phosphotransferase, partial [Solirubrobacterales bacterium]|nr:phosphotransferase [Solirubrobacterales bacterium]
RAGFDRIHLQWPGPLPSRLPQFWLDLESAAAAERLLEMRPPQGRLQVGIRFAWAAARRSGGLAPLYALGQRGEPGQTDELAAVLPDDPSWLLLTGGRRSVNKVVGLPFSADGGEPDAVVKFSRVVASDSALEREAAALEAVAAERPSLAGVPRVRALGRRGGRTALVESRIDGPPLIGALRSESLPELAREVTAWLLELAGQPRPAAEEGWRARLVDERLTLFESQFGEALGSVGMSGLRQRLASLGRLPLVCEHRDCSPWNVVLTGSGPALLDWESADPQGLPVLDLVYFLAHAAFQVDGALVEGTLDPVRARESYRRLLDPTTPNGGVFAGCLREYCDPLGIGPEAQAGLRLLCWVLHSSSEHRHLEMEAAAAPSLATRRESAFLALIETELRAG